MSICAISRHPYLQLPPKRVQEVIQNNVGCLLAGERAGILLIQADQSQRRAVGCKKSRHDAEVVIIGVRNLALVRD